MKNNRSKGIKNILRKVLADERERKFEKFQKKFGSGHNWLKTHKEEAKEALFTAVKKATDYALEKFLEKGCKPLNKKSDSSGNIIFTSNFSLFQQFPDLKDSDDRDRISLLFCEYVDPKLKDILSSVPIEEIVPVSELQKTFYAYLKEEGFEVVEERGDQYKAPIQWTVPPWYGIDLDKVNWDELYKAVQLYLYHKSMWESHEHESPAEEGADQFEKNMAFHDEEAAKNEEVISEYIDKYSVTWDAIWKPHKEVLEDWIKDVANFGEEPEHKIKLKKPQHVKSIGVEPPAPE